VCGYGRNGRQAIIKLKKFNMPCVVIEKNKAIIEELDLNNILYVEGDGTDDKTLNEAGIKSAKSLITALPSDADNLFVVLSASTILEPNSNLIVLGRPNQIEKLHQVL